MVTRYSRKQEIELLQRNRDDAEKPISSEDMAAFLRTPQFWRQTLSGLAVWQDPESIQAYLQSAYTEMGFKVKIKVPPIPRKVNKKLIKFVQKFPESLIYIPQIKEEDYPDWVVKPAWGKYIDASKIQRIPLQGKWVAFETIASSDWNDPKGYGNGNDPLLKELSLKSRFNISSDSHHAEGGILERFAKISNFPKKNTRLPTAEERHFIGTLFNWLRENREANLPDLGSTNSWEWCENEYGFAHRLVCGRRDRGGLAAVLHHWREYPFDYIGSRVLAVL